MSRFEFIGEYYHKLSEYGRKAEEAFESDKNICLLNLGRIAEYITKTLCLQNNIPDNDADELLELGIIDEDVHRKINALIEVKNEAVNDEYESEMSCERLLLTAEELCRWFMNERGESRFSFLADLFPDSSPIPPLSDLALYGREAEENLFPNTRYSLLCLGDIGESIVELLLSMNDIEASIHDNDHSDRINILYHKDIISKENKDILHELRIARNKAVHSRYNSYEEGRRLIDESLPLCEWLFRFIMSPGNFIRGIITSVNDTSIDVRAGRIECVVEGEEIPDSDESLSERYREGERRIFKVIDSRGEIIKLSIKEVYTDPWVNTARRYAKYEIGQILNVKIMSISETSGTIAEIIGPLEVTEARIPETEFGTKKLHIGDEVKAIVKWFDPKTYPYMILSVKDAPAEKKNFIVLCADASPEDIRERLSEDIDVNEKNHNGMTALMNAAMHNDNPEVIHILIDAGAKVNAVNMNSSGNTALIFAAMYNNPEVVKALIDSEADITITNTEGKTAYDYAQNNDKLKDSDVISLLKVKKPLTQNEFLELCRTDSLDVILDALNDSELDVNSADDEGRNALMFACISNNADVIKALTENTNDINAGDNNGNTALMFACDSNTADAVRILLDSGADVTLKNNNGFTAMDFACENINLKDDDEIITRLKTCLNDDEFIELCMTGSAEEIMNAINAGANLKAENARGQTALMAAVQTNSAEVITLLLDSGSDVRHTDANGNTALTLSFLNRNEDHVNMLLDYGADANVQNNAGYNALMMAAKIKDIDIVKRLLEVTSDVNAKSKLGDTALKIAVLENNADVVSAVLEAGADINAQNSNGTTSLMAALYNSSDADNIIKVLLEHKPDLTLRDIKGHTALEIAQSKHNLEGSKALMLLLRSEFLKLCRSGSKEEISRAVSSGVSVNTRNKSQATGLMFAAQKNNAGAVEVLIDAGLDIDAQDIHGNTALIYASSYNDEEVVNVLIEKGADVNIINHTGHKALTFARKNSRLKGTDAMRKLEELTHN